MINRRNPERFGKNVKRKENLGLEIYNHMISGFVGAFLGYGIQTLMEENWNVIQNTRYMLVVVLVTFVVVLTLIILRKTFVEKKL